MPLSQTIAFIGAGNMAGALVQGLISAGTCKPERIIAADERKDALSELASRLGIRAAADNREAARAAEVVVLSTKPQVLPDVLDELSALLGPERLVISIAAGVPGRAIEQRLGGRARVVRAMPNTPALVQAGATAIAQGTHATSADMDVADALFRSVGVVERVPESLMDAVTALSGSGPAYVFSMVEALTAAGVAAGLPERSAASLAAQTVYGAGKLLHESGEPPEALRKRVSSPGGTTVAGLERLERRDFAGAIRDAVLGARDRATELGVEASTKLGAKG